METDNRTTVEANEVDRDMYTMMERTFSNLNVLLPAWFTKRMMTDCWHFGLMMTSGAIIGVESLDAVHVDCSGNLWFDVTLLGSNSTAYQVQNIFTAPTSRTMASINANHVMAVFELADT